MTALSELHSGIQSEITCLRSPFGGFSPAANAEMQEMRQALGRISSDLEAERRARAVLERELVATQKEICMARVESSRWDASGAASSPAAARSWTPPGVPQITSSQGGGVLATRFVAGLLAW